MTHSEAVAEAWRALGRQLAALRRTAGYNQTAFAPLTAYSRSTIANVETGRQHVPRNFWERCDAVLGTGGVLAAGCDEIEGRVSRERQETARAAAMQRTERLVWAPAEPAALSGWTVAGLAVPVGQLGPAVVGMAGEAVIVAIDRRTLLAAGGLTALGLLANPQPASPKHVAPELVDYFRSQLAGHYQADMFLGPHHLIATVAAQYQLIEQLADAATGDLRRDLLRVGAAYAALVGWLYQDAGDLERSSHWRSQTLEMAHRSHDPQLISYALTNRAMLRTDKGDGPGVVEFAEAALADETRLSPKVRVLAMQQAAHGHSLLANRAECDRLLNKAEKLLDHVDDEYPWGNACRRTPGYVEVQRATCYGRMGLAREATALWDQVLGQLPPTTRRDTGVFLARQATAYADSREPDQAADVAREAVRLAEETGSARMRQELGTLRDRMSPWKDEAAGHALDEMLSGLTA